MGERLSDELERAWNEEADLWFKQRFRYLLKEIRDTVNGPSDVLKNWRNFAAEAGIQSQSGARGICDGQSVTGRGYSPFTLDFSCQCHFQNSALLFMNLSPTLSQ